MSEEKNFELMSKMYDKMQEGFKGVDKQFQFVNERLSTLEKNVAKIEVEHGQKLGALFDGYTQNSRKLDRIELEITSTKIYSKKIKVTQTALSPTPK